MMFVDAGAFVGRYRKSDDAYQDASAGWETIRRGGLRCFTSPFAFSEASGVLRDYVGAVETSRLIRTWYHIPFLELIRSDKIDEIAALDLMEKYADQKIGFVDCVSFVLMRKHRLTRVFGFDRHFQMAGFELWPGHGRK